MNNADTKTARCSDGTELPIDWVYDGADAHEWTRDTEHWLAPMSPAELWLYEHMGPGIDRAWDEVAMEPPLVFYRFQCAGPFLYAREGMEEPPAMMRKAARYREVASEHGGALAFWQQYCRPRVERACHELVAMDSAAPLLSVAELWAYGFHQTFTSLVLMFEPSMRLTALLTEALGEADASLAAFEVTQGGENATQTIDGEIWELAQLARRSPAVKRRLESGVEDDAMAEIRRDSSAAAFVTAFDDLLARHGSRSQGWSLDLPSWRERPAAILALVRAQLQSESVTPAELAARSEAMRRAATERALARLPAEKHAEFNSYVAPLDGYVSIREDRAYWQMVLSGEVRGLLLRRGALLVQAGRIDREDDILFLTPDDIEDRPASDLRTLVTERRHGWERWRDVTPPDTIGTSAAPTAAPPEAAPDELRGSPASRGSVTGTARIIHSPEEGARLRAGDILVCTASTPSWTPLFAVVAGIITESGGALSHPAITAREYGIPAVVALKHATTLIREGQTVTIDGATGAVRLG